MTATLTAARTVAPLTGKRRRHAGKVDRRPHQESRADAPGAVPDIVHVWGLDSFPASDAPSNW